MQTQQDHYTFLTSGPIHRVIGTMAVPTIISMLITNLYNIADTFFVGQIDTQSTAAVGVVFSLMFLVQAFGFLFGHGSGNFISRELGAQRHDNASKMAATGFVFSVIAGLLIMILGLVFLRPLSVWLGSTPTILPYTERYLRIILFGSPFLTASLTLNNQMRFQGNAAYAMYGIVTGAVLNVLLDPLFIFVFRMGVSGAALATVVGQVVSFFILWRMTKRGGNIPIRLHSFTPTWAFIKEIFYGGSPSLSRQGLGAVATLMLNVAAGAYGDAAIAAMSIVSRIAMFVMAVIIGLGQGFQPFCGFCYGAGLYPRLKAGYWFTVKSGTVILICFTLLCFVFGESSISVFRDDPDVIRIGQVALRWQLMTWPLISLIVTSNMLLQTCRRPLRANILAAARQGLFFIPLIVVLPHFFGLAGVECCQAVSDLLSFGITVPIVWSFFREINALPPADPVGRSAEDGSSDCHKQDKTL